MKKICFITTISIKRELAGSGLVIATDCSNLAPALYDADKHFNEVKIINNNA